LKTIFLLTNSLLKGGTERQVVYIAKSLHFDYKVSAIVFYGDQIDGHFHSELLQNDIKVYLLYGNIFSRLTSIFKLVAQSKPYIIYSFLLTTNVVNALLSLFFHKTLNIGSIRSAYLPPKKRIINKLLHNYFFDFTIINNVAGIENLTKYGFKKNKFKHIPNFIKIDENYCKNEPTGKIKILSVGRFDISKDYPTALNAVKKLSYKIGHDKFTYTIIGYGELQNQIEELVTQLNLENIVKIIINPPSVVPHYHESSIYLSTSTFEGLSNSILEAMSYSLPIIATNVGDNNLLVKNNENGFLVDVGDSEAISKYLQFFIDNNEYLTKFGIKSNKVIADNFNPIAITQKYVELFESQYAK